MAGIVDETISKAASTAATALSDIVGALAPLNPATRIAKDGIDALTGGFKSLTDSISQQVVKYEEYRIELTKASGANAKFIDTIKQESVELAKYGVTFGSLVDVNKKIAESYSQATFTSAQTRTEFEKNRKEVSQLISVNEKFGVGTDESIKLLNKLGNSVYNNVNQVGLFSDALLKFSRETGQPFSKVLQEFGTYSDRFITAISSDKATQSFATLELLARRSGASVDKLVSSISKFDDIDEAFSTGGQLNRVLSYFGGSFDTLAAANASDEERAKMLLESISSISDKFSEVSNPQARRSMLKEIERSSGLPMETITGLLNKNNRLSEDLTAIMRTPVEVKPSEISYTQEQKKAMAMELTDKATINQIYEESIKMGPTISTIEKIFSANKRQYVETVVETGQQLDKLAGKLIREGNLQRAATIIEKTFNELNEKISSPTSFLGSITKAFSDGSTEPLEKFGKKLREQGTVGDSKAMEVYLKSNEEIEKRRTIELKRQREDDTAALQKYSQDLANKMQAAVTTAIQGNNVTITINMPDGTQKVVTGTVGSILKNGK